MDPIKINICDGAAIKRVLDDAVVRFVVVQKSYTEDLWLSNVKLALSFVSCLLALVAQFFPAPFPDNYYVLVVCCSLYFLCSGILQFIAMTFEQNIILQATSSETHGLRSSIQIRSKLPRYESDYTLSIGVRGTDQHRVSFTKSVGAFFDSTGVFVENRFRAELDRALSQFLKTD